MVLASLVLVLALQNPPSVFDKVDDRLKGEKVASKQITKMYEDGGMSFILKVATRINKVPGDRADFADLGYGYAILRLRNIPMLGTTERHRNSFKSDAIFVGLFEPSIRQGLDPMLKSWEGKTGVLDWTDADADLVGGLTSAPMTAKIREGKAMYDPFWFGLGAAMGEVSANIYHLTYVGTIPVLLDILGKNVQGFSEVQKTSPSSLDPKVKAAIADLIAVAPDGKLTEAKLTALQDKNKALQTAVAEATFPPR